VFDPGKTVFADAENNAEEFYRTEASKWGGDGEFLGSWDSRAEGRAAYQKIIDAHLGPDGRGRWDRLYSK